MINGACSFRAGSDHGQSWIIGTINVETEMFIAVVRERTRDLPTETTRPTETTNTVHARPYRIYPRGVDSNHGRYISSRSRSLIKNRVYTLLVYFQNL